MPTLIESCYSAPLTVTVESSGNIILNNALIGPAGGILIPGVGSIYANHELTVPMGALSYIVDLFIDDPLQQFNRNSALDLFPHVGFNIPVFIKIQYKEQDIPFGYTENDLVVQQYNESTSQWETVSGTQTIDTINKVIIISVMQLGIFSVGVVSDGGGSGTMTLMTNWW